MSTQTLQPFYLARAQLDKAERPPDSEPGRNTPRCGGPLKIIPAIEHPPVIAKILAHLCLPARAPPRSPARAFNRFQLA